MLPFKKYHPAKLKDLAAWSTLSRNEVGPLLTRLGVEPLGRKFPMVRVYARLLGLSPANAEEESILGHGLIRIGAVADRFGVSGDVLLDKLRTSNTFYPPLYAFGPKRHVMLRGQVEQMLASPKNSWPALTAIPDFSAPASRLARILSVPQSRVDALLKDKKNLPGRVIAGGRVRYIVEDVAHRLNATEPDEPVPEVAPSGADVPADGHSHPVPSEGSPAADGLFSTASRDAARAGREPVSRTESG